jgi:hypothetical protein
MRLTNYTNTQARVRARTQAHGHTYTANRLGMSLQSHLVAMHSKTQILFRGRTLLIARKELLVQHPTLLTGSLHSLLQVRLFAHRSFKLTAQGCALILEIQLLACMSLRGHVGRGRKGLPLRSRCCGVFVALLPASCLRPFSAPLPWPFLLQLCLPLPLPLLFSLSLVRPQSGMLRSDALLRDIQDVLKGLGRRVLSLNLVRHIYLDQVARGGRGVVAPVRKQSCGQLRVHLQW